MPEIKTVAIVLTVVLVLVIIVAGAISKSKENMTGASVFALRKKKPGGNSKKGCWVDEWPGGEDSLIFTCPAFKGQKARGPGDKGFDPKMPYFQHYSECQRRAEKKWKAGDRKETSEAIKAHFQNPSNREDFAEFAEPFINRSELGWDASSFTKEQKRAFKKGVKYLLKIDAVRRHWKSERQIFLCFTKKCNSCFLKSRLASTQTYLFGLAVHYQEFPP